MLLFFCFLFNSCLDSCTQCHTVLIYRMQLEFLREDQRAANFAAVQGTTASDYYARVKFATFNAC